MATKRLDEVAAMLSSKQIAVKSSWRDVVKGRCSYDAQVEMWPKRGGS